ncbi:MAG: hypothetical protein ACTSR2_01350 [Candidatus Hodarchaeales archaeon]
MEKICQNCGNVFIPSKFTPYQKYCPACGKSKKRHKPKHPDLSNAKPGMHIINGKQYWVIGNGFYREWGDDMVYKDGELIGSILDHKTIIKIKET